MTIENVFGELVEKIEDPEDPFFVPPELRQDVDEGPFNNALLSDPDDPDSADDDLDGWTPDDEEE